MHVKKSATLVANTTPPDLVLNRHCGQCEFQGRCHKQATEKDDLSLLGGMSAKERKKLHGKGIFTVTQLSYTFRPRVDAVSARPQREISSFATSARDSRKTDPRHRPPRAETRWHAGLSGCRRSAGSRFLLPDRRSRRNWRRCCSTRFWADDETGEKRIWDEFRAVLSAISNPRIIHYGSYETIFLKRMCERYGGPREGSTAATAIEHPTNLLSFVYARIYFPTFSNGLKDIAGYLGFQWSGSPASGLEAIVWRHRWEASRDSREEQALARLQPRRLRSPCTRGQ